MKKALIASLLGIALNITTSHGQGYIAMQSYDLVGGTPVFSGVSYSPGGPYVGVGFKADLLYSLNGGSTFALAAGSQTAFYTGGVFVGPTVTIPGYTSGSVLFIVEAYNGASYGQVGVGFYNGQSAPFTISSLQTNSALPAGGILAISGTTATGLQPFVLEIPEPTTFALAGLGAVALMIFRRRK